MEVNALAIIIGLVILVIGPGSGVYIGIRAAQGALEKSIARIEKVLTNVLAELKTLNHRVTRSEAHIEGLERREDG